MKKVILLLVPLLLLSCSDQPSSKGVPAGDTANDRTAVSFPAPPKVPSLAQ